MKCGANQGPHEAFRGSGTFGDERIIYHRTAPEEMVASAQFPRLAHNDHRFGKIAV